MGCLTRALEAFSRPTAARHHRLLEAISLHLQDFLERFFQKLPFGDGDVRLGRVVLGAGLWKIAFQLTGVVADHRLQILVEREGKLTRAEVEGAIAAFIEIAIGDDAIFELRLGHATFGSDGVHRLSGFFFEPLEFELLGDAIELHERGVGADGAQTFESEDGALMLALAGPGADERRQLERGAIVAQETDRRHGPLLF